MIGFLFFLLFSGLFLGIPAFIERSASRALGNKWHQYIKNDFTLENKHGIVDKDRDGNKIYRFEEKYGHYTLRKAEDLWEVKCSWLKGRATFYTFFYDPKQNKILDEQYKSLHLTGLNGYISLSKEKQRESIRRLTEKVCEKIKEMERDIHEEDAEKINKGKFYWIEEIDGAGFQTDKYTVYKWKETEETETFENYWADKLVYRMTKKKSDNQIVNFYIESDYLKGLEDVDDYARKQETIWKEMKMAILKQNVKERRIRNIWEGKGIGISKEKWEQNKREIYTKIHHFKMYNNVLTEEENEFIQKNLFSQLKEIDVLVHTHRISDETLHAFIKNIEKKFEKMEKKLQKEKKKTILLAVETKE